MLFFGSPQEPASRDRLASDQPHWSWAETLAVARAGASYRVTEIVYSLVRDRCAELSLGKGDEVRCLDTQRWALELERTDGHRVVLERDYAWFIRVEPVEQSKAVSGGAS